VTDYLDLDDLLAAAEAALDHPPDIGDIGLLEVAAARPRVTAFGEEAYPDLDRKAAALLHSIVTSHALMDGNKRLGWVAVRLFYRMNGTDLHVEADEAFELVVRVADGRLRDVAIIGERLGRWRAIHEQSS
jgi:death-on-curing protein